MTIPPKSSALLLLLGLSLLACKVKNADPKPVTETKRITDGLTGKSWKAQKVQEGIQTVYQAKLAGNSYPGYQNYLLTFTGSKAKLTEYTNEAFGGDRAISETGSRTYLTLRNLTPAPTSAGGTIEFEVITFTTTSLVLTTTKANLKTGNTINTYTLEPK